MDLNDMYPDMAAQIGDLCGGKSWGLTGVSAIVLYGGRYWFEITKPKHWRSDALGRTVVGLGAIGGSIEPGEGVLECLQREAREELLTELDVQSSTRAYVVHEERDVIELDVADAAAPIPALFTVSRNRFRRQALPDYEILAIATYLARAQHMPRLGDLHGLVGPTATALREVLGAERLPVERLHVLPGIDLSQAGSLSPGALIEPTWTVRSLQVLLHGGYAVGWLEGGAD